MTTIEPTSLFSKTVYDLNDQKVDGVQQVFANDKTGEATWVTVNTKAGSEREVFIPLDHVTVEGDRILAPYTLDSILNSPKMTNDKSLTAEEEETLREYYMGVRNQGKTAAPSDSPDRSAEGALSAGTAAAAGTAGGAVAGLTAGRAETAEPAPAPLQARDAHVTPATIDTHVSAPESSTDGIEFRGRRAAQSETAAGQGENTAAEEAKAKAAEVKDAAAEKAEEAKDAAAEKAAEVKDAAAEKAAEVKDAAAEKATEAKDAAAEKAAEVKDAAAEKTEEAKAKAAEVKDAAAEKAAEAKDAAAEKTEEAKAKAAEVKDAALAKAEEVKAAAVAKMDDVKAKAAELKDAAQSKVASATSSANTTGTAGHGIAGQPGAGAGQSTVEAARLKVESAKEQLAPKVEEYTEYASGFWTRLKAFARQEVQNFKEKR